MIAVVYLRKPRGGAIDDPLGEAVVASFDWWFHDHPRSISEIGTPRSSHQETNQARELPIGKLGCARGSAGPAPGMQEPPKFANDASTSGSLLTYNLGIIPVWGKSHASRNAQNDSKLDTIACMRKTPRFWALVTNGP
ncbi:hypothetical protein CHU98_g4227 [Xylaria longipes]|nr:hypothetical protein CHU98_g4227 [Xylaria longipes]